MITVDNFLQVISSTKIKKVLKYDYKAKKVIKYYNTPFAFDIETTSTYLSNGDKFAYMYEWTFGAYINDIPYITYGRTWEDYKRMLILLSQLLSLDGDNRIVVYIHNFGYEFQFFRKIFDWISVFAVEERKPVRGVIDLGIEYRDSYILSGYNLSTTAKNLTYHKVDKLIGDLDYTLVRTPETPLTAQEIQYCYNDVLIILYYIDEQILIYGDIVKIPLTNTGRVRRLCRDNCLHTSKKHRKDSKGKYSRYRGLMNRLTVTKDEYTHLQEAFCGGYTHASAKYVGSKINNVASYDFTSSYPAVMLAEKYPMSRSELITNINRQDFEDYLNNPDIGLVFTVKFTNLYSKITSDNYLSESKCHIVEGVINNGRIYSAKQCITNITDIDYKIIDVCYSWDKIEVNNVRIYHLEYLPKPIIQTIIELYQTKTSLKDVEDKKTEYMLAKGMLNSVYGMCVTKIVRDEINYNQDWELTPIDADREITQIDDYNRSSNRVLYYPWGVWVTAYARRNLWEAIINIGDDYVYSDTDSIKICNYKDHIPYINEYNSKIMVKLLNMCNYYNINPDLLTPKTIDGKSKPIGVWDYEGLYKSFKTLGAKRYLYTDYNGTNHLTVAGLSKSNGVKYLEDVAKKKMVDIYNLFCDDMYIPKDYTGKNTHTYIDDYQESYVTDYTGHICKCTSKSSVHLESCDYTLSISQAYSEFLDAISKGVIYKGSTVI